MVHSTPSAGLGRHLFCIAPMMDHTDRHCRYLFRLMSKRAFLYTEMVTAIALARGRAPERYLNFHDSEHPVALQLGGSDPKELSHAAKLAHRWGYDEVNFNVGCPSSRVTSGRFGACLMAEPQLVAECVKAMCDASPLPVTLKTRIGIDEYDNPEILDELVDNAAMAGCKTYIIHARKAWLKGLSPKENREIPPLDYSRVWALKQRYPYLEIVLNGGLSSAREAHGILQDNSKPQLDGVMLGRAVYHSSETLLAVDELFYEDKKEKLNRPEIVDSYVDYGRVEMQNGTEAHHIFRHLTGLFRGQMGARHWRQGISRVGQGDECPSALVKLAEELERDISLAA